MTLRRAMQAAVAGCALGAGGFLPERAALGQTENPSSVENLLVQQRLLDDQLASERRAMAPLNSLVDWQWGGWIDYYFFHIDDGVQSQRVLQRPGLAVWTRLRVDNAHEVFARMRLNFSYYNPGDEIDRQQDWIGPNFDRLYYQVDVGKALKLTPDGGPIGARLRVGRQDVRFGTGLALDLPLDAITLETRLGDLRVEGLLGKTIGSYPNIDRSAPVDSHSARRMFGIQLRYTGIDRHEPFAYAFWNDDYTDERPKDRLQNYGYDTVYVGFGSRGQIVERLNYWTEGVIEAGRSFGDGNFVRQDYVQAFAIDAGVEWLIPGPMRKRVAFEYLFASGDSDRIFSPTNAAGGNRYNRKDTSFNAFGFRDTGIALAPALSNLHVFKLGGSLTPFEKVELLRDFEVGTNWFLYHKHHSRGAISDSTADMFQGFVGWEMDYFLNWRIMSDLSWTIRYGMFFPGDAFSDRDMRGVLFTGITWSF